MLNFFGGAATILAVWHFHDGEIVAGLAWTVAAIAAAVFLAWRHFNDGVADR